MHLLLSRLAPALTCALRELVPTARRSRLCWRTCARLTAQARWIWARCGRTWAIWTLRSTSTPLSLVRASWPLAPMLKRMPRLYRIPAPPRCSPDLVPSTALLDKLDDAYSAKSQLTALIPYVVNSACLRVGAASRGVTRLTVRALLRPVLPQASPCSPRVGVRALPPYVPPTAPAAAQHASSRRRCAAMTAPRAAQDSAASAVLGTACSRESSTCLRAFLQCHVIG